MGSRDQESNLRCVLSKKGFRFVEMESGAGHLPSRALKYVHHNISSF